MDSDRYLLEETAIAAGVMLVIGIAVALLYRWATGLSPWPYVILAEIGAFGWGTAMLALTSPRRRG